MNNWLNISAETAKTGVNPDSGQRYLIEYAEDYKIVMGAALKCSSCNFTSNYAQFIERFKTTDMAASTPQPKTKSGFKLKAKYEGLSLGIGSQVHISSKVITDKLAVQFLVEHPAGEKIFEVVPENVEDLIDAYESGEETGTTSKNMTADEAIEYIESAEFEDLDGFLSPSEKRKTVIAAYEAKLGNAE